MSAASKELMRKPGTVANVTQSSEAGWSDELHELAMTHVPQQALQATLTWRTQESDMGLQWPCPGCLALAPPQSCSGIASKKGSRDQVNSAQ